ncbi:MAG: hypothetical protein C7B45_00975 [Sulfobacillus acidophilus]|uniref:Uncharacterized protein n=1 Tax=Sulfobacillus acidophilus TaxID=53633 RepID=A0A2T2WNT0_9FIRM|nr:MAG: hypothetical protein C7B45_00975 [Sulfobacillus acidophilus]
MKHKTIASADSMAVICEASRQSVTGTSRVRVRWRHNAIYQAIAQNPWGFCRWTRVFIEN